MEKVKEIDRCIHIDRERGVGEKAKINRKKESFPQIYLCVVSSV